MTIDLLLRALRKCERYEGATCALLPTSLAQDLSVSEIDYIHRRKRLADRIHKRILRKFEDAVEHANASGVAEGFQLAMERAKR